MEYCPCGTGKPYLECCGRYILLNYLPKTPEELMRSRYTAYSKALIPYIIKTMKKPAAIGFNTEDAYRWARQLQWKKCEILHTSTEKNIGYVEFIVYYSEEGIEKKLHEKSEFHKLHGRWFYVNGVRF